MPIRSSVPNGEIIPPADWSGEWQILKKIISVNDFTNKGKKSRRCRYYSKTNKAADLARANVLTVFLKKGNSMEMKENKRYDSSGIEMVMSEKEYYGDACGAISYNSINTFVGYLSYFYTDKVGMAAGTVGLVQSLATLTDGISDIIMGKLVDNTNTPEGKCRPWLKRMIIPAFLAIVLLMCVPRGNATVQFAYALTTNIFARAIVLTAIILPFYSMINFMTKSLEERGRIGTTRIVFSSGWGVVFGIIVMPATNLLGGTQRAWIIFGAIIGLLSSVMLTICYKSTHERYVDAAKEADDDANVSIPKALGILLRNKYWVYMVICQLALNVFYVFEGGALPYYCKWVLGNDNLASLVNLVAAPFMISSFFFIPRMLKKVNMRTVGIVGVSIAVIGTVIRMIFPDSMIIFTVGFGIVLLGTTMIGAVLQPMIINTSEANDFYFGHRLTGMTNSAASFGGKIGVALGSSLLGGILARGGYDAVAPVQSAEALRAIQFLNIDLQGILVLVIALFFFLYDLEKKYPEMVRANAERRASAKN